MALSYYCGKCWLLDNSMTILKEADAPSRAPSQNSCWEEKYTSNPATFQPVLVKNTNLEVQMKVKTGK